MLKNESPSSGAPLDLTALAAVRGHIDAVEFVIADEIERTALI